MSTKIFILFLSTLLLATSILGKPKDCPGICIALYDPVCAKDKTGKLKTFGNKCNFNAANRCKESGSPFTFVSKGECPKDCPGFCPLNFAPVCAKDVKGNLKTFGNQCQLDVANRCKEPGSPFKLVSKGKCPEKCTVICTKEYRPVCGKSLRTGRRRTFSNKCLLEAANKCKEPGSPWKLISKGRCKKCPQCSVILCPRGKVCVTRKGCGKCVKFPTTPPCCARIRCSFGTKCVLLSRSQPRCGCRPIPKK